MGSPAVAPPESTSPSERGRTEVASAAAGEKLTPEQEHDALHFLLGPAKPVQHSVTVQFLTEEGEKPLKFLILQQDGRELDKIERAAVTASGEVDQVTANCQIVALATRGLTDDSGKTVDPKSEQFRTVNPEQPPLASPADAFEARFRKQIGLLFGVAREVRRISGFDAEKVGTAQRVLIDPTVKQEAAAGN